MCSTAIQLAFTLSKVHFLITIKRALVSGIQVEADRRSSKNNRGGLGLGQWTSFV